MLLLRGIFGKVGNLNFDDTNEDTCIFLPGRVFVTSSLSIESFITKDNSKIILKALSRCVRVANLLYKFYFSIAKFSNMLHFCA